MQQTINPAEKNKPYILPIHKEMIEAVKYGVLQRFGVTRMDLESENREKPLPYIRHCCFYLIWNNTQISYKAIAGEFNLSVNPVFYGIDQMRAHINIYRTVLEDLKSIIDYANKFENKKFEWHIQLNNTTH